MSDFDPDISRPASPRWNTLAVLAGPGGDPRTGAVAFPVYQTSTFAQDASGEDPDWCYTRTGNPTRAALERALADLEGAAHGLAFASGLAAAQAVLSTLRTGDRVVAGRDLYGGSWRLFTKVFARFGVEFAFVDTEDPAALEAALVPGTRLLWLESPTNPLLRVTDLRSACALARRRGVRTVVDNTFATPLLQRPLELGADIVLHSTTKYLNGHSDVLGGALLCDDPAVFAELKFLQNALGAVPAPRTVSSCCGGCAPWPCAWPSTAPARAPWPPSSTVIPPSPASTSPASPPTRGTPWRGGRWPTSAPWSLWN